MKFAKLFHMCNDGNNVLDRYIRFEKVCQFLHKNDGKVNKYNLKRFLQTFQCGLKTISGTGQCDGWGSFKVLFLILKHCINC